MEMDGECRGMGWEEEEMEKVGRTSEDVCVRGDECRGMRKTKRGEEDWAKIGKQEAEGKG